MNIIRCQIPAKSEILKIGIERIDATIPTPNAINLRTLVDSINVAAIEKKTNENPVAVANMECKSSSSVLNVTPGTIGVC